MNENIPTIEQLVPGAKIFIAAHWMSSVREAIFLGFNDPSMPSFFQYKYHWDGEELPSVGEDNLADRGYPGYSYDSRPNQIWLTREAAETGLIEANKWFRWDKT